MTFKSYIKNLVNRLLNFSDIAIERQSFINRLKKSEGLIRNYGLLQHITSKKNKLKYLENLSFSRSQIRQDLFVLNELNYKKNGFFIEFGAADGLHNSNTHILEHIFDWEGLIAEPANIYHDSLIKNRKCIIEKKCIWINSNEKILFNQAKSPVLSTIERFSSSDHHRNLRKNGESYLVETLSLNDFLIKYNAPNVVDYLSIDTEGSEYAILENFNFNKYKFRIITVEHNYTKNRQKIFDLLTNNGYLRKYEELSMFDDWYVLRNGI